MSGGHFDYNQYKLIEIADQIEREIEKSGRHKSQEEVREESWHDSEWFEKYPDALYHEKYPDEVITKFKQGVQLLKLAHIYVQRIDWLLSGDDDDKSFLERLEYELNKLEPDGSETK